MHYKTIILGLMDQHPDWFDQVSRDRSLLTTLHELAEQLQTRHQFWQAACLETNPHCDPVQLPNMALELAIEELEAQWGPEIPPQGAEFLSLEAAMNYLRQNSLPA